MLVIMTITLKYFEIEIRPNIIKVLFQTDWNLFWDVVYSVRLQDQCYCGQTKCTSVLMLTTKSALTL